MTGYSADEVLGHNWCASESTLPHLSATPHRSSACLLSCMPIAHSCSARFHRSLWMRLACMSHIGPEIVINQPGAANPMHVPDTRLLQKPGSRRADSLDQGQPPIIGHRDAQDGRLAQAHLSSCSRWLDTHATQHLQEQPCPTEQVMPLSMLCCYVSHISAPAAASSPPARGKGDQTLLANDIMF